jgi:hypothetical protein
MKNSKKSDVQPVKVFKQLNGEFNKVSNDSSAKIAVNYLLLLINLFQILTRKFGLKIG